MNQERNTPPARVPSRESSKRHSEICTSRSNAMFIDVEKACETWIINKISSEMTEFGLSGE
jgi:hypothetical protein